MGYSDFTSKSISSGDISVASGITIGSKPVKINNSNNETCKCLDGFMGLPCVLTGKLFSCGPNAKRNQLLALLVIILIVIYFFMSKNKKRVKSGVGLINFSISPHNEKIAIGLAIVALSMYGLDVYLKYKNPKIKDSH